jgi:nicotinate-nucleotide adenylyltransferase
MTYLRQKNKRKNVGLFGGTFNPIHYGHLKMAEAAKKKFKLDIIYFIPNGNPPHRKKDLLPAKKRYDLVKKAIYGKKHFEALDIEIKKKRPSYTIDTVKFLLSTINHEQSTYFLIGQDAFEKLGTWKKIDRLVELIEFIVFPRLPHHVIAVGADCNLPKDKAISKVNLKKNNKNHEYRIPKIKNLKYHLLKTKPINISGSEVRKKMKSN